MEPLKGVVHGSSIQFTDNLGLPEGQQVEVIVRPARTTDVEASRQRISAYKGLPDWSEEDDRILAEIANSRRMAPWRESSEQDKAE